MDINQTMNNIKNHPVLAAKFCDNCGTAFQEGDMKVKDGREGLVIVRTCNHCHVSNLIKVTPNGGILIHRSDGNYLDQDENKNLDPISDRDMLQAYEEITTAKNPSELLS